MRSGDGASWLRAPDGWLLECDPAQTTATGELLYSVVPLSGPSRSTDRAVVTSSSSATKVAAEGSNNVTTAGSTVQANRSYAEALIAPSNASVISTEEYTEPESSSSGKFYSRSAQRSRLLDIYDQKPAAAAETDSTSSPYNAPAGETASPRDGRGSNRSIPPPFSSMIDNSDESDELAATSSESQSRRQQQQRYETADGDTEEDIDRQVRKLQSLLTTSGVVGDKFSHLQDAVSEIVRRNSTAANDSEQLYKPKSESNTLRRRRHVQDIQSHMQQVARNLAYLSESMLHCQQSLASLIQGISSLQSLLYCVLCSDLLFCILLYCIDEVDEEEGVHKQSQS